MEGEPFDRDRHAACDPPRKATPGELAGLISRAYARTAEGADPTLRDVVARLERIEAKLHGLADLEAGREALRPPSVLDTLDAVAARLGRIGAARGEAPGWVAGPPTGPGHYWLRFGDGGGITLGKAYDDLGMACVGTDESIRPDDVTHHLPLPEPPPPTSSSPPSSAGA